MSRAGAEPTPHDIAIVEPRCLGLEHVPFNAALVVMVLAAYPDRTVRVYGDAGHLEAIEELLTLTRPGLNVRVRWQPVPIPPRKMAGWKRTAAVRRLLRDIDGSAGRARPAALVIATVDPGLLALVKARLWRSWSGVPVLAVFHELLAGLGHRRLRSMRWWSLVGSLTLPQPRGLRYLVLSPAIRAELDRIAPRVARSVTAIQHPSLLRDVPDAEAEPHPPPLRIGFVGGGRDAKGLREFIDLARAVHAGHPDVIFEVVGSVPADIPRDDLLHLTWSDRKLPLPEFVRRIRRLTHAVFLGDPRHYRLVASGSLADTMSLGVPAICRSGGFVDALIDHLGGTGVRCRSLADVQREVLRLAGETAGGYPAHRRRAHFAGGALAPERWADHVRRALPLNGAAPSNVRDTR